MRPAFDRQAPRARCRRICFGQEWENCAGRVYDRASAPPVLEEDRRTAAFEDALAQNDKVPQIPIAFRRVRAAPSQQLLQNAWPDAKPGERGLCLALALSSHLLQDKGARRIHGGGLLEHPVFSCRRRWSTFTGSEMARFSPVLPPAVYRHAAIIFNGLQDHRHHRHAAIIFSTNYTTIAITRTFLRKTPSML